MNAAGWTISYVQAGGSLIRSIASANSRDERLRGVRVGLEDEIYPLADYPVTTALVERGSGAFLTSCDDPLADAAECALLRDLGYDAVIVAAAGDGRRRMDGRDLRRRRHERPAGEPCRGRAAGARGGAAAAARDRRQVRSPRWAPRELLIALSTRLAAAEHEAELLEAVVGEISRAFQVQLSAVLRVRGGLLETVAFRSGGCVDPDWTQPVDAGLSGGCLRERLPVVVGDVLSEPDYRDMAPELQVRSELVVPVFLDGRAWGVIDLESDRVDAFDAEDARVVRAVAAQLGSALARLGGDRAGHAVPASLD